MASRSSTDYTVGWVCALPVEVAAAKAALDGLHDDPPPHHHPDDDNNYLRGSLHGHNVVVAYPTFGAYGQASAAGVARKLHTSYPSIRFNLTVGIAGGAPDTKEDIRLGDVVVGKSTAGWPAVVEHDMNGQRKEDQWIPSTALDQPTPLALTAVGKAETAAIFDESKMPQYLSEIVQKDTVTFAHPGPEQDILFEPSYDHPATDESEDHGCSDCDPARIRSRQPREVQDPKVHGGLIACNQHLIRNGATRDELAQKHDIFCFDTEATGLRDVDQFLVIRGICDYADSHRSGLWHAYAAAAAAAYAKEVLCFIPTESKKPLATNLYAEAAPVLDALLLTRPEVDRKSLIALKGRRVDGTCEWVTKHPNYQEWLADTNHPILWVSGGPGKGKTMLAIYITEVLQPVVNAGDNVLLYYFCSNRDKNRNTALAIMRGILHQWIGLRPHLAKDVKNSFEGTETTKYTISNFASLWRVFLTLLQHSTSSQVVCVLDGLDECEQESLRQLLDAIGSYLSKSQETAKLRLNFVIMSRPQPAVLENKLGKYQRIRLDASETETSRDVERYVLAKIDELQSEQNLSREMVAQVRQTLLDGADGTFLWVAFAANELQGRSWGKIDEVLRHIPKGLGGIYQRLLQQIGDKQALVPILQWVVLAARPLTLEELTVAAGIKSDGNIPATQVTKNRLRLGGLLVKIEGDVVNLVHESAKEFFQSEQVNVKGTDMFYMNQLTHRTLMQTCLAHVERGYGNPAKPQGISDHDPFLPYASQYWPMHLNYAVHVIDAQAEFARPFFAIDSPIRDEWWKVYWEQEKNGGNPPSFTLFHLAAYFGNVPCAKLLIGKHKRLISRKDNYGRTPLSWAVNQGRREMVALLLDQGVRVNFRDRSRMTALHIAVIRQHRDVVSLLLDHGARLEAKAEHGDLDTPLIRAIMANSKEITQDLLERGARVDKLPALLEVASVKGPADPMDERVKELLGLQEQVSRARFKRSSQFVDLVMRRLSLCLRFPLVTKFVGLYLEFIALNRWEYLSVLQELVEENKTEELREWAKLYHEFFLGLMLARNVRRLKAIGDLPAPILEKVAPRDLQALMAITVFTGMEANITALEVAWREGAAETAAAISNWADIACERDALESFHFGFREFLRDFDDCIRDKQQEKTILQTAQLITVHFAMIEKQEPAPLQYFSRVVAEFFEGYIGSSHEVDLFGDATQAYANELSIISQSHDSPRLRIFLTSIFHFARQAQEKGQDHFLNMPSRACLILCQEEKKEKASSSSLHRWLIGEALPQEMAALIAAEQEPPAGSGSMQKRACKTLVECLIIGQQYGFTLPKGEPRRKVEMHLQGVPGIGQILNRILGA